LEVIEMRIFRKSRTISRKSALALAAVAVAGLGFAATAAPASASTNYSVDESQACKMQYGGPQYVAMDVYGGPYGWVCYSVSYSFPWGVTLNPVGGLNLQAYCSSLHPGSRAVLVWPYGALNWVCQK
jgi:hypothetical protein